MTNEVPDPWEPIGGSLRHSFGDSLRTSLWDALWDALWESLRVRDSLGVSLIGSLWRQVLDVLFPLQYIDVDGVHRHDD